MKNNVGMISLSVAVIIGSIIVSFDAIYPQFNKHVIEVEGGKVMLGEIYSEEVNLKATVAASDDGSILYEATGQNFELHRELEKQIHESIEEYNRDVSDEDRIVAERAMFSVPVTITMTTAIDYRSEHFTDFHLIVDENTVHADELAMLEMVDIVSNYQKNIKPELERELRL